MQLAVLQNSHSVLHSIVVVGGCYHKTMLLRVSYDTDVWRLFSTWSMVSLIIYNANALLFQTMASSMIGYGACILASVFFASVFVPVKKFDAGNGIFVQWIMSAAIFCVGMAIYALESFPVFHPLAMLGGSFWAFGNATAVPIMNVLGLGLGMLIWGVTNCITGWAVGRFGLFGVRASIPSLPLLNYFGLLLVIIGGMFFSRIRPTVSVVTDGNNTEIEEGILRDSEDSPLLDPDEPVLINRKDKRIFAMFVALLAGVFYGVTFVPVIYIQDHPEKFPKASKNGLEYVFSHFCGIFTTATLLLILHIVYSANRPVVNSRIIGPSLMAGSMWGIAQASWFVANDNLSQSVTFPIITMMPGVGAALWSVFYFREITGKSNLLILTVATFTTLIGAFLVGISK